MKNSCPKCNSTNIRKKGLTKDNRQKYFCKECCSSFREKTKKMLKKDTKKICPNCASSFFHKINKYCSKECSHKRILSSETKNKISASMKLGLKEGRVFSLKEYNKNSKKKEDITLFCQQCQKEFFVRPHKKNQKYCSPICRKNNIGGYREHSGNSKSGYYKGIFCNSTYELAWVIYMIDKKIPFKRFNGILSNEKIKYIPDFLVSETKIIEIKGYYQSSVDEKAELAKSLGYEIEILYKEDLKEIFEYVKETYKTNYLESLYDNSKPKYSYICHSCEKEYFSHKKKKTKITFCSLNCIKPTKIKK